VAPFERVHSFVRFITENTKHHEDPRSSGVDETAEAIFQQVGVEIQQQPHRATAQPQTGQKLYLVNRQDVFD
jgi:hypothetical protein